MPKGYGTLAFHQVIFAENTRQTRTVIVPGSEDLFATPVDTVDDLTQDDGSGGSLMTFIFGLHDPFSTTTARVFPGPGG